MMLRCLDRSAKATDMQIALLLLAAIVIDCAALIYFIAF